MSTRIVDPKALPTYPYSSLHRVMSSGHVVDGRARRIGDSRLPVEPASFHVQDQFLHLASEIDAKVLHALDGLNDYLRASMTMDEFQARMKP